MLTKLNYSISPSLLNNALLNIPSVDFKTSLNVPTGEFFYDRWEIKPKFKNTVWEEILASLPNKIGEARIIILEPGTCYQSHADIDDRYHLTIQSHCSYLINIDSQQMCQLVYDNTWYEFDASCRHSAANFGVLPRIQLVVRKLLPNPTLTNSIAVKLTSKLEVDDERFMFDDVLSPWLNLAIKNRLISNFKISNRAVFFEIEKSAINELNGIIPKEFKLEEL